MNNLSKYLLFGLAAILIGLIVWYFRSIVVYILISAILALMGNPLMNKLNKVKLGRFNMPVWLSALVTLIVISLIFLCLFLFIAPLASKLFFYLTALDINSLSTSISEPLERLNRLLHETFNIVDSDFKVENIIIGEVQKIVSTSQITTIFASVTNFIINLIIAVFVILFITFFFLKEQNMFNNMVIALFPDKYEPNVSRALQSVNELLTRYFIGISVEAIFITILNGFGLYLIAGVDFSLAFALSFISGVLNVIPYIGPWTGGIFGVLMSLIGHNLLGPNLLGFALTVAAIFFITHMIDVFIFQPYIYSNSVKAHPLEIFLVILIAGSIGGIVGMLVAIPTYTVIRVFAREFFSNFKLVKKLTNNMT